MNVDNMTLGQLGLLLASKGLHTETNLAEDRKGARYYVTELRTADEPPATIAKGEGKNSLEALVKALENLE